MTEIKARTTMYKGIKMRSRLEADFAAFLDSTDAEWEYEPFCFAGPDIQWLPDFRVVAHDGKIIYFEVKPESLMDGDVDAVLDQMTVAWLTEPEAVLELVFWRWREPEQASSLRGIPDDRADGLLWWWVGPDGGGHAWPGAGQLEHLCHLAQIERAQEAL